MRISRLVDKLQGAALVENISERTEIYMRTPGGLRKVTDVVVEPLTLSIGQRALNKKPKKILVIK